MKIKALLLLLVLSLFNKSFAAPTPITIVLQGKDEACGAANGSIEIQSLYGGNPPYTYLWTPGFITIGNITNLSAGTYTILVTDVNGVTASASYTINNYSFLNAGALSYIFPGMPTGAAHPCKNLCNGIGFLDLNTINGTAPYSLSAYCVTNPGIVTGFNSQYNSLTVENICSYDNYTVLLTDANGCSGNPTPTFNYPITSFAFNSTIYPACNGVNNGSVNFDFYDSQSFPYTITFTGPSPTVFNNFQGIVSVGNLLPGTYQFTVTNSVTASLCDTTFSLVIPNAGTNCGTVSGQVYLDTIRNCNFDINEPNLSGRLIEFNPGNYFATSDNSGNYTAQLPYGTYSASTVPVSNYYSVCNSSGIVVSALNNTITNVNLADSSSVGFDISVGLFNSIIRPGFDFKLYVTEKNLSYISCGNSTVSVVFPSILTFVSTNLPYTLVGNQEIILDFGAINAFQTNTAEIVFTTPPDPNLIGTFFGFTATLTTGCNENYTVNNYSSINPMIRGSYDPNEKYSETNFGGTNLVLVDINSQIRYTVRFQNTGNDTAFNVVIIDTLDANLNVASIELIGASHPYHWELTGHNILKVYFDNILLVDSTTNEPASHGAFSYKILTKDVSQIPAFPSYVYNKADIYFDFNPPITTNTTTNVLEISVGLNEQNRESSFHIYPNPASKTVTIKVNESLSIFSIRILDMQGRVVRNSNQTGKNVSLDIATIQSGIYLIEVDVKDAFGIVNHLTPQRVVKN